MLKTNAKTPVFTTANITRIAVLSALSAILFLIEIPVVAFYKLDLSNLPALLGGFAMGPIPGVLILLIKDLTGMLHSSSMYVGELADFIMGAAIVLPSAIIYRRNRTRKGAMIGMVTGVVVAIVVAVLVNWQIMLPFYSTAFGMPMEAVVGMAQKAVPAVDSVWKLLLYVTAPFNLLKGFVLSLLTFLLYKRLAPLLHGRR